MLHSFSFLRTTASSYIDSSTREANAAAEIAAARKMAEHSNLTSQHTFYPIAVETLGPLTEALQILPTLDYLLPPGVSPVLLLLLLPGTFFAVTEP